MLGRIIERTEVFVESQPIPCHLLPPFLKEEKREKRGEGGGERRGEGGGEERRGGWEDKMIKENLKNGII